MMSWDGQLVSWWMCAREHGSRVHRCHACVIPLISCDANTLSYHGVPWLNTDVALLVVVRGIMQLPAMEAMTLIGITGFTCHARMC